VSSTPHERQRAVLVPAVRGLVASARAERARLPEHSSKRQFYLGVDAAAQEFLHPQIGASRADHWLQRETPNFREGYERTSILLANMMRVAAPPFRIPLPDADTPR
jgi:hypothetical protein